MAFWHQKCVRISIESRDNATEEGGGDKANAEHNAVNATITSKSIISAQRALNGILTPEMRSHIDRIAWQVTTQPKKEGIRRTLNITHATITFEVDYLGSESFKWHSVKINSSTVESWMKWNWFNLILHCFEEISLRRRSLLDQNFASEPHRILQ